jgi:hypothetical protein
VAILAKSAGFAAANSDDAAIAAYALVQSLMASFVERGVLSPSDASDVIERASRALRRRSDDFERAAAILDQEARFWSTAYRH